MNDDIEVALGQHVAELRTAFDQSFARPLGEDGRDTIDFVALRLNGDLHALRMSDIGGLVNDAKLTPCPSPIPELKGIAAFRGVLTPVYDLAQLLGYPASECTWMVLTGDRKLALAFDTFEGHFRVVPSAIAPRQQNSGSSFVVEAASHDHDVHPIISVAAVVEAVAARVPKFASS